MDNNHMKTCLTSLVNGEVKIKAPIMCTTPYPLGWLKIFLKSKTSVDKDID